MRRLGWMVGLGAAALLAAGSLPPEAEAQGATRFRKHMIAFGIPAVSAAVADFNGDGRPDVAAASEDEVAWYDRGGGKSFWARTLVHRRTERTGSLATDWLLAHDLDGDGDLDLITHSPVSGNLAWFENPGAGAAADDSGWTWRLIDNLPGVRGHALEDLNRDGRPELIANYEGAIAWYPVPRNPQSLLSANYVGDPAGRAKWDRHYLARSGASGRTHYLSFADMDGDGDRDLLTGASQGGYLAWWERPADATLLWTKRVVREELPGATHLLAADLDGDKKAELVYSLGGAKSIGWLGGAPDWEREGTIDDGWLVKPHTVVLADLDGDGDLDLAAASLESRTAWWENDGKGRFTRRDLDASQAGSDLRAVDVDGDGDLDLVLAGGRSKNLVWFENLRR
ncbi:MAG: FG-GAP repeat domain-containing protein [Armatimonadota bacterium]